MDKSILTLILGGLDIIPNRFLQGHQVLMCTYDNVPLGLVDINTGPFHKDMKKLHMSYECMKELEKSINGNSDHSTLHTG